MSLCDGLTCFAYSPAVNGFAYFIWYIFGFFFDINVKGHNSLVSIYFQEVMFQYNFLIMTH